MQILYEDNHLLIINKPSGILTQPSGTDQKNIEDLAKQLIKERDHKPGNVFLHAVHRLDKPVSGIVIFAKTSKALSRLNASIRRKEMVKTYIARIGGTLPDKEGTLEHKLDHDNYRAAVSESGKLCRLHYRQIDPHLVEVTLETGRYHQIRAQLAAINCPIDGDSKYGSGAPWSHGIALHHSKLIMKHPVTGEILTITAEAQAPLLPSPQE
ncbi:MAG: RluA family pseudouridine synthase [Chlamydiales bacterium]|nr:RluA family pseudouridine synthase [Chlamydiia bacterium]MCP5508695.1 RluA family pseudouridine synthase [Chlamydiales bacterium]